MVYLRCLYPLWDSEETDSGRLGPIERAVLGIGEKNETQDLALPHLERGAPHFLGLAGWLPSFSYPHSRTSILPLMHSRSVVREYNSTVRMEPLALSLYQS